MTTYTGTQTVEPGLYVNARNFRVTSVEARGPLPGTEQDRYRRVPMLVMLASAPLLGLAFVMFLPFIGFAVMLRLLGEKLWQVVAPAATTAVDVAVDALPATPAPTVAGAPAIDDGKR